jgi:hypothetical protein
MPKSCLDRQGLEKSAVNVEISHPLLRQLYEYWDSKRAGRAMPARSDLDPIEIPDLLRHLILLDITHDPLRFRVRLYGTGVAELRGHDLTGRFLYEDGLTPIGQQTRPWNVRTVEDRQPHYTVGDYTDISDGRIGSFYASFEIRVGSGCRAGA